MEMKKKYRSTTSLPGGWKNRKSGKIPPVAGSVRPKKEQEQSLSIFHLHILNPLQKELL